MLIVVHRYQSQGTGDNCIPKKSKEGRDFRNSILWRHNSISITDRFLLAVAYTGTVYYEYNIVTMTTVIYCMYDVLS